MLGPGQDQRRLKFRKRKNARARLLLDYVASHPSFATTPEIPIPNSSPTTTDDDAVAATPNTNITVSTSPSADAIISNFNHQTIPDTTCDHPVSSVPPSVDSSSNSVASPVPSSSDSQSISRAPFS